MPQENLKRRNAKRLLASAGNHCFRAAEDLCELTDLFLGEQNEMGVQFAEIGQALLAVLPVMEALWEEAWGPPPEGWITYH